MRGPSCLVLLLAAGAFWFAVQRFLGWTGVVVVAMLCLGLLLILVVDEELTRRQARDDAYARWDEWHG